MKMRTYYYAFFKESGILCSSLLLCKILHGFCRKNCRKNDRTFIRVFIEVLFVFDYISYYKYNFFHRGFRVSNASSVRLKAFCVQNFITDVTQLLQPCQAIQSSLPTRKRQTVMTSLCQQKRDNNVKLYPVSGTQICFISNS